MLGVQELKEAKQEKLKGWEQARSEDFIKLSGMRGFTKMAISGAAFGVRRPTSTTFVDIFKGYNAVVYTEIKFQVERGQKDETVRRWRKYRAEYRPDNLQQRSRESWNVVEEEISWR